MRMAHIGSPGSWGFYVVPVSGGCQSGGRTGGGGTYSGYRSTGL
jgi:hypothetical protein